MLRIMLFECQREEGETCMIDLGVGFAYWSRDG